METPYEPDELPFLEEVRLLETMMRPAALDAVARLARYKGAYDAFKSVRKAFLVLDGLGLADPETKELTAKGRCLNRLMCVQAMEHVNAQVCKSTEI